MKNLVTKLTSRKFLVALAGVISGAVLAASGNVTEGVATVIASVLGYLAAEGLIDAAAVKATAEKVADEIGQAEDGDEEGANAIGFNG